MEQRLFIELANLHQVTPQWVEQKQGFGFDRVPLEPHVRGIELAQREIRTLSHELVAKKNLSKTSLRKLKVLADPERVGELHEMKHPDVVSPAAILAARDFLDFYQTENHKRLHRCQWCRQYFIDRPNKKYCGPDCKDNYWNRQHSVSGYSREDMRKHRAKE